MGLSGMVKDFFKEPFNRYLFIGLLVLGIAMFLYTPAQGTVTDDETSVHFFYMPTCPHCAEQEPILRELEQEYPDVHFYYHDASTLEGSALYLKFWEERGIQARYIETPTTIIGQAYLKGVYSKEALEAELDECIVNCSGGVASSGPVKPVEGDPTSFELPFLGRTDLTSFSLPVLAVLLGLIDGFNPCAMWVLVYMISVIANIGDRRKIWLIVGSFVFASGTLYFLFMTAWLNVFLLVGYVRFVTILVGLVALAAGILNLRSYFKTKGAMVCNVGDAESHKKTMDQIQEIASSPLTWGLFASIVALAFAVNAIEFVCSSALPAVFTQVLALKQLSSFEHYLYILLYVFFFMLDDLIIFSLAAMAVTRTVGDKYAKWCKLFGGIIILIIGLLLLFAPQFLR